MEKIIMENQGTTGKRAVLAIVVMCLSGLCLACAPIEVSEKTPVRSMGVSAGPELVFDKPVTEILPTLEGATATGINGRVGNELVFWGYRLQDNSETNLFACAMLEHVDCESRSGQICLAGGQEQARVVEPGTVRELNCRAVGRAGIGDLLPNCEDHDRTYDLLVGLMQCR